MSNFMENVKSWQIILGMILLLAGSSIGIGKFLYAFDKKKADVCYVESLEARVDAGFAEQIRDSLVKRIWAIEDQYGRDPSRMPQNIRDDYRKYQEQLRQIDKKLELLYKKQQKGG